MKIMINIFGSPNLTFRYNALWSKHSGQKKGKFGLEVSGNGISAKTAKNLG